MAHSLIMNYGLYKKMEIYVRPLNTESKSYDTSAKDSGCMGQILSYSS